MWPGSAEIQHFLQLRWESFWPFIHLPLQSQSEHSVSQLPERRINSRRLLDVGCGFRAGVMMKLNLFPSASSGTWNLSDLLVNRGLANSACL